ncbi:MAG: mechanosensitive ion channel family protein [Lentisphaeria bacterium]|nr:mechanosensitive ion channel family protein [Lentisphaeria bacterium]
MIKTGAENSRFDLVSLWSSWEKELGTYGQWMEKNSFGLLIFLLGTFTALLLFLFVLLFLKKILLPRLQRKHRRMAEVWGSLALPGTFLIPLAGVSLSSHLVSFPGNLKLYLNKTLFALFVILLLNGALRFIHNLNDLLVERFRTKDPESYNMNKLLMDLSRSLIKLAIWVFGTIFILQDIFGLHITALMASAGILGLGIAFAAQNTIGNLFGAFSILGSKLFKVGDWIKTGNVEGIVEQIGFRSVRIRAFEGRLMDVPNRVIADAQVENFSNREYWREHFVFSLTYQTDMKKMERALQILEEIGEDMEELMLPEKRASFTFLNCSASSLDIDGYVWFRKMSWFEMRSARGCFNRETVKRFTENGIEFAYPTTTVYIAPSSGGASPAEKVISKSETQ